MAQLVLSRVGAALGARFAPQALQNVGAALGREAGGRLGRIADSALFGESRRIERARLEDLRLMGSREGAGAPLVYGRARIAGQVIWASRFRELREIERVGGGKGGGAEVSRYRYTISFAVGLCAGPIARIERAWANGAQIDLSLYAHRVYRGDEAQSPDPAIEAIEGSDAAPAYKGLAYIVFEDFPLDGFGAVLPQLSFEVVSSPEPAAQSLEQLAQSVNLIPGSGEFVYETTPVARNAGFGREASENAQARSERANLLVALDHLQSDLPNVRAVSIVASWFGDDLRCGFCSIAPRVETADKETRPLAWSVAGYSRESARETTRIDGAPAYGGTPSDHSVHSAIAELKRRGFAVGLNPFLLMDIGADNALPDPYGAASQAAYPWRGRLTAFPGPGASTPADKTAAARSQIEAFFLQYRAFVLHYAQLAADAGGVDFFVIGSELRGLTTLRDETGAFPAVERLRELAGAVRAIVGPSTKLTYGADWSEYAGHQPQDGSGDVFFHLDPLWADSNIDAIGLDWYPPLTDWRDGGAHADLNRASGPYDQDYLRSCIEGGEAYDWYYADAVARDTQTRTPITDGAFGKPWIYRAKDLRRFWEQLHFDRPGGVESATPTAWIPQSKPLWFNEIGVPAIEKGANAPNLFVDPKSNESAKPPFSSGARDDLIQRRALEAYLSYWDSDANPASSLYDGRMIDMARASLWAWDARPFPHFPARADVWRDGAAWRVGHWLNGRCGAALLSRVVEDVCARAGIEADASALEGVVSGYVVEAPTTVRAALEPLLVAHRAYAVESGGRLTFRHAAAAVQIIAADDVVDAPARFTRAGPEALPVEARVRFIDAARDYRVASVSARRAEERGEGVLDLDLPITLDPVQAEAAAVGALRDGRAAVETGEVTVAPWRLDLEVGDCVDATAAGAPPGVYQIVRIEDEGARRLTLVGQAPPSGPLAHGAEIGVAPQAAAPRPHLVVLDLPPLPGAEGDDRPLAAIYAQPWAGPHEIFLGVDRSSLTRRGAADRPATVGAVLFPFYPGPAGRWDDGNTLYVEMPEAALSRIDNLAALAGAMTFAVARPEGGWELVAAQDAVLIGPDRWALSRLLRGLQGTEPATDAPSAAGATVVRIDRGLVRLDVAPHERGAPLIARAPPAGRAALDPSAAEIAIAPADIWARPFAPAHLRGGREPGGDIVFTWVRRSRNGGDAWIGEPPLAEEREAYAVEIGVAGAPVRRWTTGEPSCRYTLAEQIADFGGAAGPLTLSVAQISTRYGSGTRRDSFLTL